MYVTARPKGRAVFYMKIPQRMLGVVVAGCDILWFDRIQGLVPFA